MASHIGRRKFLATLGGAAAAWPLTARAQQAAMLPTIGFLGPLTPSVQSKWTAAFVQRMREHGWIEGRTVAIELCVQSRSVCYFGGALSVWRG
jgi:putative tryptophan/tyrosine transport system substrate-binding protein